VSRQSKRARQPMRVQDCLGGRKLMGSTRPDW
jgi:hypothetical protein